MLVLASANRDGAAFPNPDVFDVTRFRDTAGAQFTPAGPTRAFGGGVHTCTGSLLAKVEMELMLEVLLDRYKSMTFTGVEPTEQGFFLRSADALPLLLHRA